MPLEGCRRRWRQGFWSWQLGSKHWLLAGDAELELVLVFVGTVVGVVGLEVVRRAAVDARGRRHDKG